MIGADDDLRLRREALQIALQLPTDQEEALRVLDLARELVRGFLAGRVTDPPPIVPLPYRVI